jgi:hypothetical protein
MVGSPGVKPPVDDPLVAAYVAAAQPSLRRESAPEAVREELQRLASSLGLSPAQLAAAQRLLIAQGHVIAGPSSAAPSAPPVVAKEIIWIDDEDDGPAAPPVVQPPPLPSKAAPPKPRDERLSRFQLRAMAIIAENRGFGPKTQAMLVRAAKELGLSDEEADAAMQSLRHGGASAPSTDAPSAAPAEQAVVDPPVKPHLAFRAETMAALVKRTSPALSRRERRTLINRGVSEFRLGEPFARRIVDEVAAECGLAVEAKKKRPQEDSGEEVEPPLSEAAEAFLERARQILAEHRGVNAKSRVLLNAAAATLGVDAGDVESLIARLQRSNERKPQSEQSEQELLESYRQWLDVRLARLEGQILTARDQRRFLEAAEERHGISAEQARTVLAELAARRELRFISADEARRHVQGRVQEALQGGQVYDLTLRYRLTTEAEQWGLEPEEAESLVDENVARFKGDLRRRANFNRRLLTAAVGVLLLVGLGLGAAVLLSKPSTPKDADLAGGGDDRPGDAGAATGASAATGDEKAPAAEDKSWWDIDLAVEMAAAKTKAPEFEPLLAKTRDRDPAVRTKAYRELIAEAAKKVGGLGPITSAREKSQRAVLEEIIAGCYARDPDEQCAAAIAEELVKRIPAGDALPADATTIRQGFWAAAVASAAISRPAIAPERAAPLAQSLSRGIGLTVDPALSAAELTRFVQQAMTAGLYRKLASEFASQPDVVKGLEATLSAEAAVRFDRESVARLEADYLATVAPSMGADWRAFQDAFDRCVQSRDPLIVLKMADACERAANPELQEWLRYELLMRVDRYRAAASTEEAMAMVREALGASARSAPLESADRYRAFLQAAEKALAEKEAGGSPRAVLASTLNLAHLNSLGCALARQDAGRATFDELLRSGPPKLKAGAAVAESDDSSAATAEFPVRFGAPEDDDEAPPASRPRVSTHPNMRQFYLNDLRRAIDGAQLPAERAAALAKTLPRVSKQLDDLDPRAARDVADYLCRRKSASEHEAVMKVIDSFAKWKAVRLVIADELDSVRLDDDQLLPILSGLTGREIEAGPSSRAIARRALLESVVDDLEGAASSSGAGAPVFDEARDALLALYVEQAKVSGVAPTDYSAAAAPSHVLKLLILNSSGAATDPARPADAALMARLPQEVAAVEYLGADDLDRTVLLQRLWLRTCSAALAGERSEKAAEADGIVATLAETDRKSGSPAERLRDGETAILKLWLLWNRP